MNVQEVGQMLGLIAARYPNARLGQDEDLTIQAWTLTLEDIPLSPHAELALRAWFRDHKWPPDASEIRELALRLGGPTPEMMAKAEREMAASAHWRQLLADASLTDAERRRRQQAFRESLAAEFTITARDDLDGPTTLRAIG